MARLLDRSGPRPIRGMRVLITGGSSGIGLACAQDLSAAGANVVILARGEDALQQAAAQLDPPCAYVVADVADVDALRAAVDRAAGLLGGLDAVISNAGAATYGPFLDLSPDDYRRTIDITLLGMINTAHVSLPHLERTHGTLLVVGSIASRVPTPWLATYTAAKHGVRGFARSLAAELKALGNPVQVAQVLPGPVDTPFFHRARSTDGRLPSKLHGVYRPQDVAAEVTRMLARPRLERTFGAAMAAVALFDSVAPNLSTRAMAPFVKLGWRKRKRRPPSGPDALSEPVKVAELDGDLPSRPSVATKLRDLSRAGQ